MSLVMNTIQNGKWAITETGLQALINIANRNGDMQALALAIEDKKTAKALRSHLLQSKANGLNVKGDRAVISINGAIIPYADMFKEVSGCCSIESIKNQFAIALGDASIKRVLLDIDSPGGNVTEVHSLVQIIFEARSHKLIEAYIGGLGCSAAYWIASAATKIYIDKTAEAGSVGVVYSFIDTSARDEMEGIKRKNITNTDSKKKRIDPKSEEFIKEYTVLADDIAEVFFEDVARNRGVTVETVKKDFGKGGVFVGAKAVKAGLCDETATFEDLFKTSNKKPGSKTMDPELKAAQDKIAALEATITTQKATITNLETSVANLQNEVAKTATDSRKGKYDSLVDAKIKEATAKGHDEKSPELAAFKTVYNGKFDAFKALDDETIKSAINANSFSVAKRTVKEPAHNIGGDEATTSIKSDANSF